MEIRKDSWHYKVYEFSHDSSPSPETNLCRYFWRVMWGLTLGTLMVTAAGAATFGLGLVFYRYPFAACLVVGGIILLMALFFACYYINEKRLDRKWAAGYVAPEPGLLRSYLKAKKEKVCPLITFVNSGDNQ